MNVLPAPRKPPATLPRPNETCWCQSGEKYKKCHKALDAVFFREERARLEANRVRKGIVSPMRSVPATIARPDYADSGRPLHRASSDVRTLDEIVRMRRAGKAAAHLLQFAAKALRVGMTTEEIDVLVHEETIRLGGYPSTLNYHGFQKALCTSVNEVICHGIPDSRKLLDGDIVNLDVTIFIDGVHGDTNGTFAVGNIDDESKRLIEVTKECLQRGIDAVKPARPLSDIGRAIQTHAEANQLGVVRAYCGHGICDVFHTGLQVPHYFDPSAKTLMTPGMTFTIEPMITIGSFECSHWDDDWTVVTKDLKRSAQFEHTIVVTETGAEVLTA
jgi:methionyl aminopeptidase